MPTEKVCPRCRGSLLCRAEDVSTCACATVRLGPGQQQALQRRWQDCLCLSCLKELQSKASEEIDAGI